MYVGLAVFVCVNFASYVYVQYVNKCVYLYDLISLSLSYFRNNKQTFFNLYIVYLRVTANKAVHPVIFEGRQFTRIQETLA